MKNFLSFLFLKVLNLLSHPFRVFLICMLWIFFHLFIQGRFFEWMKLSRDEKNLNQKIEELSLESKKLDDQMKKMKNKDFVEKLTKERWDLVSKGDLIFLFSDSDEKKEKK